jgi:hypothetical protein
MIGVICTLLGTLAGADGVMAEESHIIHQKRVLGLASAMHLMIALAALSAFEKSEQQ